VSRPSNTLAESLANEFRALEATRSKIEVLWSFGMVSQRDVLRTYQGLFLDAHISFERFIEQLFVGLLIKDRGLVSARRDVVPRITVRSYKVARDVILGPRNRYVDWMPYEKTLNLAAIFFRGGRPFSLLLPPSIQTLASFHYIRNALAHKSRHSLAQFKRHVIGGINIPPRERRPVAYLRGTFRVNPPQTRYENLIVQLARISRTLAK